MSPRMILACCMVLAWPLALQAATIYRTTDEQGNVIFTDQPERGGEQVELRPLTVVPSPSSEARSASERTSSADAPERRREASSPFMPYDTFRIVSPQDEETLPTGGAGNVQVQLEIEPELREDHRVRLLVDGQVSQSAMHSDIFMLTNLDRGERLLQAELLDANGQVRHRSAPVTLYVQRASANLPQNPNNPG